MQKKISDFLVSYKEKVEYSFSKAVFHYDHYSLLQRKSGKNLCKFLGKVSGKLLLDAGCGTGWFSKRWKKLGNKVIALDLSVSMLDFAKKNNVAHFYLAGDIEYLPLASNSLDIVFSNLAIQWCENLKKVLSEFHRVLKPGGIGVLSTLTRGSLIELEKTWSKIDNYTHINQFLSKNEINSAFSIYHHQLYDRSYTIYFKKLINLLKSIKRVGAGFLIEKNNSRSGLSSRSLLDNLESNWPRNSKGFTLTYQVIYGVLYCD